MGDAQDHQDMREDEEDLFGEEDFEGSEEAKELPNVIPKCHKKPTVSEIVAHNRSHTPYRSWCKHCVAGRAPNLPHQPRRPDQGALNNEIAADYCFLRNAARDVSQPVLVDRDRRTGIYIAHAVNFKGAGVEWIAKQMLRDVRKCGYHGRVVSKTTGEPAILDLMGEVARLRGDLPTVLEHGAPGDSQSNGFVERAIRSVEDMIRTHKLALEEKIGEVLKVDTAAMAWLVEHCADILNKCQQGKDGRTPYERLRGKQFSGSMLEFGSQVMLKVMDKVSGGVMQERWVEGTWLGSRFTTLEHLVARMSGLGLCVTFRSRQPWKIWTEPPVTHTPRKAFNVTAGWTYPDLKQCQNQKSIAPLQNPIRVVPFLEQCSSPEPCWKGMVILRDANDATPCDVDRLMAQVVTLEIAADAWRLL